MTQIKTITLATDFSEASKPAMEYARHLRDALQAELTLLHVLDAYIVKFSAPYFETADYTGHIDEWYKGAKEAAQKHMSQCVADLGGDCKHVIFEEEPRHGIVTYLKEHPTDLLVMGTHGHHGLKGLILGSVAQYVVQHAECPVLTIKPKT